MEKKQEAEKLHQTKKGDPLETKVFQNPDPSNTLNEVGNVTQADFDSVQDAAAKTEVDVFGDSQVAGFSFDDIASLRAMFGESVDPVGKEIGDYTVESELGRGGMGVVYKAMHRKLNRIVALKMILLGNHGGTDSIDRFLTEAQTVAKLQHLNIVQIFDVGEHEGLPYFSLEYIEGKCLKEAIADKSIDAKHAAKLVLTIAQALHYAHGEGIVHRDIKPANILLTPEDQPKITDFGLAKLIDSDSSRTRTGQVMGTPSYMSPEQASGQVDLIGPASDQYSLGALLYRLITGRPPFSASDPVKTIMQVVNDEVIQPRHLQSDLPRDLETICLKALQKNPTSRYGDCKAMAVDLENFLAGKPIVARPVSKLERAWRWCKRNPGTAIPSIATAMLLVGLTALSTWAYATVASQNEVIRSEKEFAQAQERVAKSQTKIAEEKSRVAVEQAGNGLKVIQDTLTFVNKKIAAEPALADLRVSMAEMLTTSLKRVDPSVLDDEEGEAIPTMMTIQNNVMQVFISKGKYEKAIAGMDELIKMAKRRVEVRHGNDATRKNLAILLSQKSKLVSKKDGDLDQAIELISESISILEDIINSPKPEIGDPNTPKLFIIKIIRGQFYQSLGAQYFVKRDNDNFKAAMEKAIEIRKSLVESLPSDTEFLQLPETRQTLMIDSVKGNLQTCRKGVGMALMKMGDFDVAFSTQTQVADFERKRILVASTMDLKRAFANTAMGLGFNKVKVSMQHPDLYDDAWLTQSKSLLLESSNIFDSLVDEVPDQVDLVYGKTVSKYQLGILMDHLGEADQAQQYFQQCHEIRKTLQANAPSDIHFYMLMVAAARDGDWESAKKMADEKMATDPNATSLFKIARGYALASTGEGAPSEALLDMSFAAVKSAVGKGFNDWFELQYEPDLELLRKQRPMSAIIEKFKPTKEPGQ